MKCPYCEVHIDKHKALDCLNLWIMKDIFGWTTSISPYKGDYYPKGSYFVIWNQPDDFMPKTLLIVSQAFDKDGNNLRSTEENPFGMWEEGPSSVVPFFYCTRIADAWLVVEKLRQTQIQGHVGPSKLHRLRECSTKGWGVIWCSDFGYTQEVFADTAPLAICLSALKAVENK